MEEATHHLERTYCLVNDQHTQSTSPGVEMLLSSPVKGNEEHVGFRGGEELRGNLNTSEHV